MSLSNILPAIQVRFSIACALKIVLLSLASFYLSAETFNFEDHTFNENERYSEIKNQTFSNGVYGLTVRAGLVIDDSYLSEQWSRVLGEDTSFHPSKAYGGISYQNNSLITQRAVIETSGYSTFTLCSVSVASKRENINSVPFKVRGTYFVDVEGTQTETFVEQVFVLSGDGYETFFLAGNSDWEQNFTQIDLRVGETELQSGQLHFDDIQIKNTQSECEG